MHSNGALRRTTAHATKWTWLHRPGRPHLLLRAWARLLCRGASLRQTSDVRTIKPRDTGSYKSISKTLDGFLERVRDGDVRFVTRKRHVKKLRILSQVCPICQIICHDRLSRLNLCILTRIRRCVDASVSSPLLNFAPVDAAEDVYTCSLSAKALLRWHTDTVLSSHLVGYDHRQSDQWLRQRLS